MEIETDMMPNNGIIGAQQLMNGLWGCKVTKPKRKWNVCPFIDFCNYSVDLSILGKKLSQVFAPDVWSQIIEEKAALRESG